MSVHIALPPLLSEPAGGEAHHDVAGGTLGEALAALARRHPELEALLWEPGGGLRPFLTVIVNERQVGSPAELDLPLQDGDEIVLVSALEGGR